LMCIGSFTSDIFLNIVVIMVDGVYFLEQI